jgi:hypothetical protein
MDFLHNREPELPLFSLGNSSSSPLFHWETFSLFFTEVIRSLFFLFFQRKKGIGFRKREVPPQTTVQRGRGPLGILLSLVESRVFFPLNYIGVRGYFRVCESALVAAPQGSRK